jgi:hypothetical protein
LTQYEKKLFDSCLGSVVSAMTSFIDTWLLIDADGSVLELKEFAPRHEQLPDGQSLMNDLMLLKLLPK